MSISGGDCLNLRDYLEAEGGAAGLLQGALYRQGFRDCVQALHLLGVLGMRKRPFEQKDPRRPIGRRGSFFVQGLVSETAVSIQPSSVFCTV